MIVLSYVTRFGLDQKQILIRIIYRWSLFLTIWFSLPYSRIRYKTVFCIVRYQCIGYVLYVSLISQWALVLGDSRRTRSVCVWGARCTPVQSVRTR